MLKYMLDTNVVIYVLKRKPLDLLQTFNQHAGQMSISSITLAELFHGAEKSSRPEHNLRVVEDFISRLEILEYGIKAAAHYGGIRANLERSDSTPIGENDLHIAGHARSEGLILVTNNKREFERVEALRIEHWISTG
jgi:tRNA(fMet)-specific endonuclease VapC